MTTPAQPGEQQLLLGEILRELRVLRAAVDACIEVLPMQRRIPVRAAMRRASNGEGRTDDTTGRHAAG